MLGQYAGATATPRYLRLEDFEREGVRVAERSFGGRDIIFSPGDPGGQLYFLLSGTVRLYKIYGAYKEATLALLKDGGVFGERWPPGGIQAKPLRRSAHQRQGGRGTEIHPHRGYKAPS